MQRIKMMLVAMVAVLAIGAVGASAASAGTMDGTIDTSVGPCDFLGDHDGWYSEGIGWATDGYNFRKKPGGTCAVDAISGSAHIWKAPYDYTLDEEGNQIDPLEEGNHGAAKISDVHVHIEATVLIFFEIECDYTVEGPEDGIWWWQPHNTNKHFLFEFDPPITVSPDPGSDALCPDVDINGIEVDVSNP